MPRQPVLSVAPGQVYGRLLVTAETRTAAGRRAADCLCECGATGVTVAISKLLSGHTTSCGCAWAERIRRHGVSRHPSYKRWWAMVDRCTNPANVRYSDYGARGITVYDGWLGDPVAFVAWLDENLGPCPDGWTLDRLDNDGNYEPGNLRWAAASTQANNRRKHRPRRGSK